MKLSEEQADAALAAPITARERIEALDVVRGFALLGILLMNIVAMGLPGAAYSNPMALGPISQADFAAWFITNTFFEGSMRTLFSMLFGAGFLILLERLEARGLAGAKIFLRRVNLLMLFGLVDIVLFLWYGDILFIYGFTALFLLAFWKASLRGLALWALLLIALMTVFSFGGAGKFVAKQAAYDEAVTLRDAGVSLSQEQSDSLEAWPDAKEFWSPSREQIQESLDRAAEGWGAVASYNAGEMFSAELGFFFFFFVFDALAAMLLGMIAYRIGLLQGKWSFGRVATLTLVCFGAGLPINLWETQTIIAGDFSIHAFFATLPTYHVGRVFLAGGWLGVVLMACKAPWLSWLRAGLAAVGRMALSNYLAHSIIAAVLFVGLGAFGELSRAELYLVVVAMWAFNVGFSLIWLSSFSMGPFEWLWRAGTYGAWPPLRRDGDETVAQSS